MQMKNDSFNDNILPDYEPLFNENAEEIRKKPIKILAGILSSNWVRILLSTVLYVIKACPVWIMPIITANIINSVTQDKWLVNTAGIEIYILECRCVPTACIHIALAVPGKRRLIGNRNLAGSAHFTNACCDNRFTYGKSTVFALIINKSGLVV